MLEDVFDYVDQSPVKRPDQTNWDIRQNRQN